MKITEKQLNKFNEFYACYYNEYFFEGSPLNNDIIKMTFSVNNISFLFKYNNIIDLNYKPMHLCVLHNYVDLLTLLITKYKVDINIYNYEGLNVLMIACNFYNYEMVDFLLKYGMDVNIKNNNGWTCFDYTSNEKIINLLKEYKNDN